MPAPRPLTLALVATLVVGCSAEDPEPPPGKVLTASVEPVPLPPEPVEGVRGDVRVTDLSVTGSRLYPKGSRPDRAVSPDDDAVAAVAEAAATWVDDHLNDLQFGLPGHVVDAAGVSGDPEPFSAGIGGPDRQITSATYALQVGTLGAPEWIRLVAEIHRDGVDEPAIVTFVFLPDGAEVSLLAVHAGSGTEVPAPADDADDAEDDS